jgi:hypothetical protein
VLAAEVCEALDGAKRGRGLFEAGRRLVNGTGLLAYFGERGDGDGLLGLDGCLELVFWNIRDAK